LRRLSEDGVGLIIAEPNFVDVNAVAADFPDTRYVAIDFTGRPRQSLPNVSYVSFAQNEGSFLVGAAAALESRTGRIGFIGGMDIPMMHEFQAGYEAGARAVDPSIEVRSTDLSGVLGLQRFRLPDVCVSRGHAHARVGRRRRLPRRRRLGTGCVPGGRRGFIDDICPQIEDLRAQIIAGDVVVPSKPAKA
jgi:ABC transporter substrate-binding protein PnrA-like